MRGVGWLARLNPWVPVVLYVGFIFGLSSIRQAPPGPDLPQSDKLLHLGEYGILGLLLVRSLRAHTRRGGWITALALAAGGVVGVTDELYQQLVPGRISSLADVGADMAGVGLALLLWWWLKRRHHGRTGAFQNETPREPPDAPRAGRSSPDE